MTLTIEGQQCWFQKSEISEQRLLQEVFCYIKKITKSPKISLSVNYISAKVYKKLGMTPKKWKIKASMKNELNYIF